MIKLYINESAYIKEDIEAVKKYYPNIANDMFMDLIALDPTYRDGSNSVGKYGKWILNLYNKGNLSNEDMNSITDVLNQFTTYKNRIQNKDLNSYKSLSALEDILATVVDDDSMLTDRQKLRFMKNVKAGRIKTSKDNDYDVVLETPKFIIYVPNTHEASMKLGAGTRWCTAHEDPKAFEEYNEGGNKLYIIKNKQTGQLWQYGTINDLFADWADNEVNAIPIMRQDKELSKFFKKFLGVDYYTYKKLWVYDGGVIPEEERDLITDIVISDNINTIDAEAFYALHAITSIVIPNNIINIGKYAFYNCTELLSATIPNSVIFIGEGAFRSCPNLTIYTNNDYVIDYCSKNRIPTKPLTHTESYKLHIKEGNYI